MTFRAILVALLCAAAICGVTYFNDYVPQIQAVTTPDSASAPIVIRVVSSGNSISAAPLNCATLRTRCRTSVSDLEVIPTPETGTLWSIRYHLVDPVTGIPDRDQLDGCPVVRIFVGEPHPEKHIYRTCSGES
jgi:hypothetical protein